MQIALSTRRSLRNAAAFGAIFLCTTALALHPDVFNRPFVSSLNITASGSQFAANIAFWLSYPIVQGGVTVLLVSCCWFSTSQQNARARIIAGILAAILAGILANYLQKVLATSPKPIFDPILNLDAPAVLGDIRALRASFNHSHTFPSPRATMFMALATTIFLIRPKLGVVAFVCTAIPEIARIFLGLHYITDLLGSLTLGCALVWLSQLRWIVQFTYWFTRWELASPSTFYVCAIVAGFEIARAFDDLRTLMIWFDH